MQGQDGPQVRMVDVFDPTAYEPRPDWGQTDEALLDRIFANSKAAWMAAGQWFVGVPAGVQDYAVHTGEDFCDPASYTNPDGTTAGDPSSEDASPVI